ncbi:MerR family transcriptional regulator [Brachyspira catarrhinii]|uniref:MerR family transcriptional regulator n=1 Tax=Brachyspira catarrhinii TaxID=2528966 RepID=A0ABY2TR21_9SPIR|nr:MerR family transcriptional regulator [Brachyspira catarrhinii]TKZ35205.1 MerR family transcriptional regulator [Brachyspira catarrhinii]
MTIAEVSKKINLSADTLRYYERIGLIPEVNRTESGIRNYTEKDLGHLEFVICFRNAGVSIETLIEYMRLYKQGDSTLEARKQLLISQREIMQKRLDEIQNTLDKLNFKIDNYEKILIEREKELLTSK